MAIKARFSSQQQPVKIVESDGAAYVFICLNGFNYNMGCI